MKSRFLDRLFRGVAVIAGALSCVAAMADEPFNCHTPVGTDNAMAVVSAQLAGVPAILRIPKVITKPPIVLWHGFGPPASELALMDALPLDELPAVKVYLGVPLFGARAPAGGVNELIRRQSEDFASLLFELPYYRNTDNESRLQLTLEPGVSHDWSNADNIEGLRKTIAAWFARYS